MEPVNPYYLLFLKRSRFGYMLSLKAIKVPAFRCIKWSTWRMYGTYVSIWVMTSKRACKQSKATCMLS